MADTPLLAAPGPVPIPEEVALAMAAPLLHHRTPQFTALLQSVLEDLRWLLEASGPVALLSGSGSVGMEAALVNLAHPDKPLIGIGGGKFGSRWGVMGRAWRLQVHELEPGWGQAADPAALEALLRAHPDVGAVAFSACETSTGVWHPVEALCEVVRRVAPQAFLLVDGITAVGAHPLPMDALGIDALVVGSQKVFAVPPGLAAVALSQRALDQMPDPGLPRFTLDLRREVQGQAQGKPGFTPATSLIMGMAASLRSMRRAGLEALHARHALHAQAARAALRALDLKLVAEAPCNAVSAFWLPQGVQDKPLLERLRQLGVVLAGGQGPLAGRVARLGHLGSQGRAEILFALSCLELALAEQGAAVRPGDAVAAAQRVYARGLGAPALAGGPRL